MFRFVLMSILLFSSSACTLHMIGTEKYTKESINSVSKLAEYEMNCTKIKYKVLDKTCTTKFALGGQKCYATRIGASGCNKKLIYIGGGSYKNWHKSN